MDGRALPFSSGAPVQCYGDDASAATATESIPAGRPGSPSTTPSLALIKFYFPKRDCLLFCPFPRHVSVVDPPPAESTTREVAAQMLAGTARAKSTTREVAARTLAGTARAESKTCDVVIRILAGTARAESTPHKKFLRFQNLIFGSISRPRNKVKSVAAGIRNYRTSTTNRGAKIRSIFPPKTGRKGLTPSRASLCFRGR